MSSFNINGPSNLPQITGAQNMQNDGGAGNTGYLGGGGKKKKKKEEEINPALLDEDIEDRFEHQEDEYEDDDDYYRQNSDDEFTKDDPDSGEDLEPDDGGYDDSDEPEDVPKSSVKDKFFGLVNRVSDKLKNKNAPKNDKGKNDDNGGDFLSLSKKN